MSQFKNQTARATAVAAGLVGWSFIAHRIPTRWRVPVQAVGAGVLMLVTRAAPGLRPPQLWSGLRGGLPAAAAITTAVAAGAVVPPVRAGMAARELPESPTSWLALHIPVGTVWAEEAAFRAALPAITGAGTAGARLLQAITFGLSHIPDARGAGAPVVPTVLITGLAGWLFGWLADRTGSLVAPICAHLAANEAGALAVLAVQRRSRRSGP